MKRAKTILQTILLCGLLTIIIISCETNKTELANNKWTISEPILTAGSQGTFDDVAVKDPSIVYYKNKYHLFYTAKSEMQIDGKSRYSISCAYTSAETLENINNAERFNIDSIVGDMVIAPQVFYFEPQKLWYIIAHTKVIVENKSRLMPIYLTNPNIENVHGWSEITMIKTARSEYSFWIDFWVICDDKNAHMFYSDQKGSVWRLECPLNSFPEGFSKSKPELALYVNHIDEEISWKMFEAVHIYHVKKENKYLAFLEGAYKHPANENDVDARSRFIFGMTADSLNGEWKRLEKEQNIFLANAVNMYSENGKATQYTQVSHPELIRYGYNQKLEIEDYNFTMLFQTFDGSRFTDTYKYDELPWELILMKNY
ncbi:MAG: hypothetical protein GQ525_11325 [Draconibacterium sp.]|nr:hypothetical protein [Draconibacterium sp.]